MTAWGLRITWTIVAIIGLGFNIGLFWRSLYDYKLVVANKLNGLRRYSARTSVYIFVGGIATQASYTIVGIVALVSTTEETDLHYPQIVSASVFITASVLSTVFAGVIFYRRRHIIELIEESYGEGSKDQNAALN